MKGEERKAKESGCLGSTCTGDYYRKQKGKEKQGGEMDGHSSRSRQVWKTVAFVGGLTELTMSAKVGCCERLQCSGSFKI